MTAESPRRRWLQRRLRTLLGIMTGGAAAAAWLLAPRVREQALTAWLQEEDARTTLEAEGPEWLRHLADGEGQPL